MLKISASNIDSKHPTKAWLLLNISWNFRPYSSAQCLVTTLPTLGNLVSH